MLTPPTECYRDRHSTGTEYPYSPEANDVWSLGVLFLELACGDRVWDVPCNTDAQYQKFRADPSAFIRAEYPLSDRTRLLLLRILSPESYRISLEALREEIYSIDDFYLSDHELATAAARVQENAIRYGPWTNLVEGLDDTPYENDGEDLFTDSDSGSSTGEFVDICLATLGNDSSHSYLSRLKDEKGLASCIAELDLSAR